MADAIAWAYGGYLLWLAAGWLDFAEHRRGDLAHTSGVAESRLHAVQLGLLGAAILAWLALAPGLVLGVVLGLLVAGHAMAGYADTRVADGRRHIGPREQHLHSILDMAPWFALCLVVIFEGGQARDTGWTLQARGAPPALWLAVLLPALPLCVLPWLAEYRASLRARGS